MPHALAGQARRGAVIPPRPVAARARLRAVWRLARVLAHVTQGVWLVTRHFQGRTEPQRQAMVVSWSRRLLTLLAIELEVRGLPAPDGPVLLLANHISWIDITVIHAARFCRFVSKGEVRRWPLIGALAHGIGTLFIERESRRDAMRVVHHMAQSLRAGDVLAVFPEGTTSDGLGLLPFHANLLQAAIAAQAPIQPVAIQYLDRVSGCASLIPAYVGDDHLMGSIWRVLCASDLQVVVNFSEPQGHEGRDRRQWAAHAREVIAGLRG